LSRGQQYPGQYWLDGELHTSSWCSVRDGTTATVDALGTTGTFTGKSNGIPPVAYASGDIRTLSDEQTAQVEAKMKQIVSEHLAKTDATIDFQDGYPPMPPTPGNRGVLGTLNQTSLILFPRQ
jgi:glutamate carboxypeptidase